MQDTMGAGLRGMFSLCIFGRPYIVGGLLAEGLMASYSIPVTALSVFIFLRIFKTLASCILVGFLSSFLYVFYNNFAIVHGYINSNLLI